MQGMSKKKRERGQGSIGRVKDSKYLDIWLYGSCGHQRHESSRSTIRSVAQELLNRRLGAMSKGERPPAELKSVRYDGMREILLADYQENKISAGNVVEQDGKLILGSGPVFCVRNFRKASRRRALTRRQDVAVLHAPVAGEMTIRQPELPIGFDGEIVSSEYQWGSAGTSVSHFLYRGSTAARKIARIWRD